MSVTIRNADIFDVFKETKDSVLCHCANCFCKMKSGIAKVITEKIPDAPKADSLTIAGDPSKLGTFSFAHIDEIDGVEVDGFVANLYGQFDCTRTSLGDRDVSYDALYNAMCSIRDKFQYQTILFPYQIGSNLAGGRWPIVEAMIRSVFEEHQFPVIICKIEK